MSPRSIARKIDEHLSRLWDEDANNNTYNYPGAFSAGPLVTVWFNVSDGAVTITKEQAEEYLTWLDAGNDGTYYKMILEKDEKLVDKLAGIY